MPLIHCPACGNQVSSEAPTCPNCGNPIRKSRKLLWFVLGGLLLVGVVLLIAIASDSSSSTAGGASTATRQVVTPPPPAANFKIVHVSQDEGCTQLGDYCVRAYCTYMNAGDGPGDKAITAALLDAGQPVATRQSSLTLMPNATKEVTFDFTEAELDDDNNHHSYRIRCGTQ